MSSDRENCEEFLPIPTCNISGYDLRVLSFHAILLPSWPLENFTIQLVDGSIGEENDYKFLNFFYLND